MLLASGTSIPTQPTAIPTIAGAIDEEYEAQSESNSARYDDYATDEHTDHTDLASELDIDESEYRRELLNDVRIIILQWLKKKDYVMKWNDLQFLKNWT